MDWYVTRQYLMPTKLVHGVGSASMAGTEAARLGITRALIVTDAGVHRAGLTRSIEAALEQARIPFTVFAEVEEDPAVATVERGVQVIQETACDGVIVVGGGSPLSAGKAMTILATNPGNLTSYEGANKYKNPPLPMIAIPTTAGSGSEVSRNGIITDSVRQVKMIIGGESAFPRVAILDPELLLSLPYRPAMFAGIDALTHTVEAYVSAWATPLTDALASGAARLIGRFLGPAICTEDKAAKAEMLLASAMSNIACGNAPLGLVHATSDPLCALHHVAHGHANGLMLPYVMEYNLPAAPEKFVELAAALGAGGNGRPLTPESAVAAVVGIYRSIGFPSEFPAGATEDTIPDLARRAIENPLVRYNVRRPTRSDLEAVYRRARQGWVTTWPE
jgi:alcohol dehydrogenase class IV